MSDNKINDELFDFSDLEKMLVNLCVADEHSNDVKKTICLSKNQFENEAYTLLKYKRKELCNSCNGSGSRKNDLNLIAKCDICNGKGIINSIETQNGKTIKKESKCQKCNGRGIIKKSV